MMSDKYITKVPNFFSSKINSSKDKSKGTQGSS